MKVNMPPAMIAATIAGGGLGVASGFMVKGEESENRGASTLQQLGDSVAGGISYGVTGAGIGIGVSGTAVALKKILGK
jgi:hypothetical protein